METLCSSCLVSNDSSWLIQQVPSTPWTKEENKLFESALAIYDEKTPNRWFKVAEMIPGKSVCDVMNQYRVLEEDVSDIEAGLVPIPGYLASSFTLDLKDHRHRSFDLSCRKRARTGCAAAAAQERKKGVPWTEDEHRRFLLGLEKHGKGDWRSISRNFVISKTPTQVASHAQKYYLRQVSGGKDKRRPSIHDITVDSSNTTPSRNNKIPRLDKSYTLKSMQKPNMFDDGAFMVLDSMMDDHPFVMYPRGNAPHDRYLVNIVGSGHVHGLHNVQTTRFHG